MLQGLDLGVLVSNYLKMPKKQQVIALLALKWSFRRIERATGVRRETISGYARKADSNPANVFLRAHVPPRSAAAAYHEVIVEKLKATLTAQRIFQDLVSCYGYGHSYESVKRYIRKLPKPKRAVGVFHTLPGDTLRSRKPICYIHGHEYASRSHQRFKRGH